MNPEQEMRAVAIQAAASFCAPFSAIQGGAIPNPEDVLFVADVFYGYVEGGWERALEIHATGAKAPEEDGATEDGQEAVPQPVVKDVELREERPAPGGGEVTFDPDPVTVSQVDLVSEVDDEEKGAPAAAQQAADVIPLTARGRVDPAQAAARRKIEDVRRKMAEGILKEAAVAKAVEHKDRLRDKAEGQGLSKYRMEIDGQVRELGAYLATL